MFKPVVVGMVKVEPRCVELELFAKDGPERVTKIAKTFVQNTCQ